MDQDPRQPLIPCVFCNHLNTAAHRFCGMCGKALPDPARKMAKPSSPPAPPSSTAPLRGIGGGPRPEPDVPARPIAPIPLRPSEVEAPHAAPVIGSPPPPLQRTATPAAASQPTHSHNDPHRDLSYLLEEDHVAPKASRVPWMVGGLLLAAVVGFFAMRGGGKPPASSTGGDETATSDSVAPPSATPARANHPAAKRAKENPAPESAQPSSSPDSAPPDAAAEKAPAASPEPEPAAKPAAPPVARTKPSVRTSVAKAPSKPPPRPTRTNGLANSRKPSPAQPVEDTAPSAAASVDASSNAASSNCDGVPALRKAADRGDVKARTSLGLVYYSGQCVPRDLPTAYHWYALALHANPDSQQLSAQLEAIWKQMSPAERQLAIHPQP